MHTKTWLSRHPEHHENFINHTIQYDRKFARRNKPVVLMGKPVVNQVRKEKKLRRRNEYLISAGRYDEIQGGN